MRFSKNTSTILSTISIVIAIVTVALSIYTTRVLKQRIRYLTVQNAGAGDKLSAVLRVLKNSYVDTLNMDTLSEKFIPKVLEELDPHSVYIPKQEFTKVSEQIDGEFDGIGITFNMLTDTVVVMSVIPGGPSAQAGLMQGDKIVSINGENVAGVNADQEGMVDKLRGKRGTTVELGIERPHLDQPLKITVTRGVIPITSVDCAFRLEGDIAYIKLSQFSKNAHSEFLKAWLKLSEESAAPIKHLIFDLRGNMGGRLDQAIYIANEFFGEEKLIVYTEGAHFKKAEQFSNGRGRLKDVNVKLLINEHSASASEIVAGALQDNDRCTIIGRRSFGKGLVQQQMPFRDGSALRITVARYYTPLGRSIQKPYDKGVEEYNKELYNRFMHSEMLSADSIHFDDTTKYITAKGKVLYGGGGIMPDIFVPADTLSGVSTKLIYYTNALLRFSVKYSAQYRDQLNELKTFEQLDKYFDKNDGIIEQKFWEFVAKTIPQIKPTAKEKRDNREFLKYELRAIIGRTTPLDENAFMYLYRPVDKPFMKAVESIRTDAENLGSN